MAGIRVRKMEKKAAMRNQWQLTLQDGEKRLKRAMERDDQEAINYYTEQINNLKKALATN